MELALHVAHIALQGCLRGKNVEYGVKPDTGGHIRYLLDLIDAVHDFQPALQTTIFTRRIVDPDVSEDYGRHEEIVAPGVRIVRLDGNRLEYLPKEEMHTEHEALVASAREWCQREGTPDVWHGHYADAGALAARLAEELGGSSLFTGHSLGRVKQSLDATVEVSERRIALEEEAIAGVDGVIVSSREELEKQYGLYRNRPRVFHVLPPGSSLCAPTPDEEKEVARELGRFLRRPELPTVLAIARPVRRKNLVGLIEAFALGDLRERANLVLVAGVRDLIYDCAAEIRQQLRAVMEAIDAHDLYGSVAIPKRHRPEEIPAYYAYARDRRGVFVNIADHEPFGLTLIEAAAFGLPVVATRHGGPSEIVPVCGHGHLVDPRDPAATAKAMADVLDDPARWEHFSRRAEEGSRIYSWRRHAEGYLDLVRSLRAEKSPWSGRTLLDGENVCEPA